jgi:YbbR domain-containing protein
MRDWITKDFGWKLFSVVLAVIIWLTVHKIREEPENVAAAVPGDSLTYGNLPVQVVSSTTNVHNFHVIPATVAITVSGPSSIISVLQATQIRALVDLSDIQAKKSMSCHVDIVTPLGVTLVKVDPPDVQLIMPKNTSDKP